MKNFIKKHFWIFIILLYVLGVLAFTGTFVLLEMKDGSAYDPSFLNRDIGKSLIVAIPPLFYPIYKYFKSFDSSISE